MRFLSPTAYRRPCCAVRICRFPDDPASAFIAALAVFRCAAAHASTPWPIGLPGGFGPISYCGLRCAHKSFAAGFYTAVFQTCAGAFGAALPAYMSGQRSWGSCPSQFCSGPQVRTAFSPSTPHLPFPGCPPRCFLFEGTAARVLKRFAADHGQSIAAPGFFPAGQPCLMEAVTALGFASSRSSDAFIGVAARARPRALPPTAGDRFRFPSAHEL